MAEKKIYINNVSKAKENLGEEVLINVAEQLDAQILTKDFLPDTKEVLDAPVIIRCDDSTELGDGVLEQLKKQYASNQNIILVNPTNKAVNTVYKKLENRNYCATDDKNKNYSLFGLKLAEDGIRYVLEEQETTATEQADSIVDFLEDKHIPHAQTKQMLKSNARKALSSDSSTDDLATMAKQHLITKNFTLLGKPCSLTYYMVSCHKFVGTDSDGGEDWFFIQQNAILNGGEGYDKHKAHTRIKVNGESWYVGEGDVCLNYIDYYKMQNYLSTNDQNQVDADLVYVAPQSINNVTTCTVSEDVSVSGTAGFEGGTNELKGTASFSCKAGFSNSYSFQIQDCTCKGTSLSKDNASAEWVYSFKRASQNRAAGKWQHLYEPADLARSTFSPVNTWVWKFDTKNRKTYKSFTSNFQIGIMNTISRYSGSQSPKDISGGNANNSVEITLNMPPLLCVNTGNLIFDNEGGTRELEIASQGSWSLEFKDQPGWIRANTTEGSGKDTTIYISVDPNTAAKERLATLQIYRMNGNTRIDDVSVKVNIIQSAGKIKY
jgi:hypothetical protein